MIGSSERVGWVLYNASCGFCRRWIPFWAATLRRIDLGVAPLQEGWVQRELGLADDELLLDLRLLLRGGVQVVGADAYRFVMKRIWWAYPLFLLASAPVLRVVFDWGYRTFARNRHRVSRACGLPPREA